MHRACPSRRPSLVYNIAQARPREPDVRLLALCAFRPGWLSSAPAEQQLSSWLLYQDSDFEGPVPCAPRSHLGIFEFQRNPQILILNDADRVACIPRSQQLYDFGTRKTEVDSPRLAGLISLIGPLAHANTSGLDVVPCVFWLLAEIDRFQRAEQLCEILVIPGFGRYQSELEMQDLLAALIDNVPCGTVAAFDDVAAEVN